MERGNSLGNAVILFSNAILNFYTRLELMEAQETAACWWLVDLELELGVGHEAVDIMRLSVGRPGVL